jgi:hypothetical protein
MMRIPDKKPPQGGSRIEALQKTGQGYSKELKKDPMCEFDLP